MVYALDYIAALGEKFPDAVDGTQGKEVEPYIHRSLSFLLEIPGILPHINLAKALDRQATAVLTARPIIDNSFEGVDTTAAGSAPVKFIDRERARFGKRKARDKETNKVKQIPWFSLKGRSFWKAIWEILGVLAVIKVFAIPEKDLRDFIATAQGAWASRFTPVATGGAVPQVFEGILARCNFPALPDKKGECALAPIPVTTAKNGIAFLDKTLREISRDIAANPQAGGISFKMQMVPRKEFTALNAKLKEILDEKKVFHESRRKDILRPEDPASWGIGDRVGSRAKDRSGLVKYLKDRTTISPGDSATNDRSIPDTITKLTAELGRCKAAEVDLDCLRRRYAIYLCLGRLQKEGSKDVKGDVNKMLAGKHFAPLTGYVGGEGPAFDQFDLDNGDAWAFVTSNVETLSADLDGWFVTHKEACADIGINKTKFHETQGALKRLASMLDGHIYGRGLKRMGLANELRLAQIELALVNEEQSKASTAIVPPVPPRLRFQRALEYLSSLYNDKNSFLYEFFHPKDGYFTCKVKLPDPVAVVCCKKEWVVLGGRVPRNI